MKPAGLSQEELAYRAGINRTYPLMLGRGLRSPTVDVLLRLAGAMETTPVDLMQKVQAALGWERFPQYCVTLHLQLTDEIVSSGRLGCSSARVTIGVVL
jgi:transcriptional regulator with XRE-family HTH domain